MMGLLAAVSILVAGTTSCGGRTAKKAHTQNAVEIGAAQQAPGGPVQYTFNVVKTYPHDVTSYTQGLYWHEGYMWEGTGEYGNSKLRQIKLESGEVVKEIELEERYFGEGIALLDGLIYQLTWREGEAFAYDASTFERVRSFKYAGEGWGLATDGAKLYMSDGSNRVRVLDPETFRVLSSFEVMEGRRPVAMLNEMEWIDGKIWANVYQSDEIVIIDPATGRLTGRIDLRGLLSMLERTPYTDVLNGIAYDAKGHRIFVTGKRWPKIYEIELVGR